MGSGLRRQMARLRVGKVKLALKIGESDIEVPHGHVWRGGRGWRNLHRGRGLHCRRLPHQSEQRGFHTGKAHLDIPDLLVRTNATTGSTMQRHSSAAAIKTSPCMLVQPDVILVITALHKPAARFAIDTIERAVRERNVPFIARPGIGSPPVARHAPWPGIVQHFAANTLGRDETGMARGERYLRRPRRAKHAERKPGGALTGLDLLARSEFGHTKRLGAMCIEQ